MTKKFEVTITETDAGIEIFFIDYTTKRKADLGEIKTDCTTGIMCKMILAQVQRGLGIADLVVNEEKE